MKHRLWKILKVTIGLIIATIFKAVIAYALEHVFSNAHILDDQPEATTMLTKIEDGR